jgi:GAF domain-containing protein
MGLWEELALALVGAVTDDQVLDVVADVVAPAVGAHSVNISVLTEDGLTLRLVASRHTHHQVEDQFATYSARAPLPSTDALLTGTPVLLRDLEERDRRYPVLRGVPVEQRAFAILPLQDSDGSPPLGILGLGWVDTQPFPEEHVDVLVRVAQVCASALARSRAHVRERQARARAERTAARLAGIHALSLRLAATVKADQVAAVLIEVGMPALGATAAAVVAHDGGTGSGRLLAAHGIAGPDGRVRQDGARSPLADDVLASRDPVLVTSAADLAARYPTTTADGITQQAWAVLPLRVDDQLVGVAAFGWDDPRAFTDAERQFLSSLATHTAIALDRTRLLEAAQTAADTVRALQEVTAGLSTAATREQIATVLVDRGIRMVADHGVVAYLDDQARCWQTRCTPGLPSEIARRFARIELDHADTTPITRCAATGQELTFSSRAEIAAEFPLAVASHELTGTRSLLVVPVRAAGRPVAALAFGFAAAGPVPAPVASIAATLADLAGQALERAQLYEVDHRNAHQLQRALLPRIAPDLPGVTAGVRYRPAEAGHEVGGDWYDLFPLPAHRVGIAVGDVVGHDLHAATVMGRLQTLLKWVALTGAGPAQVLESLDAACRQVEGARFSSVGYAEYDPADGLLRYACAGHPPPLLVEGHEATYLWEGRSPLLGVPDGTRAQAEIAVPPDAVLVWYTDGLVERRGEVLDRGLERLAACAAALPSPTDPGWRGIRTWTDRLLSGMVHGRALDDDIVVVAVHLRTATAVGGPPGTG